jgi:predicted dithiol-disulfide oxidoreductase (DUF899 family)
MPTKNKEGETHAVVPHARWLAARRALLAEEKKFTRLRDRLSQRRRDLPWERVEKDYVFDTDWGKVSLAGLFEGRSQLVIYHFMFDPRWKEGCEHCSFWADNFNGVDTHLRHRDVTFIAMSRAPLAKLKAFKRRMKWGFRWVSSHPTDFNYDYDASFKPAQVKGGRALYNYGTGPARCTEREGVSVFLRDGKGSIFHTYSSYARGIDMLNLTYHYLDLVPKGRGEDGHENAQYWVRYHDRYGKD